MKVTSVKLQKGDKVHYDIGNAWIARGNSDIDIEGILGRGGIVKITRKGKRLKATKMLEKILITDGVFYAFLSETCDVRRVVVTRAGRNHDEFSAPTLAEAIRAAYKAIVEDAE
jgi:hypothetical protein